MHMYRSGHSHLSTIMPISLAFLSLLVFGRLLRQRSKTSKMQSSWSPGATSANVAVAASSLLLHLDRHACLFVVATWVTCLQLLYAFFKAGCWKNGCCGWHVWYVYHLKPHLPLQLVESFLSLALFFGAAVALLNDHYVLAMWIGGIGHLVVRMLSIWARTKLRAGRFSLISIDMLNFLVLLAIIVVSSE